MADEQRIRLALEILGAEGVTDLRQRLDALNAEGGELAAALGRGEISAAEFDEELRRVAASARGLESALDGLEKGTARARGGVAGFGQTALQTGRVVQDFAQGGIGGILNNIEGLTAALGLGSGLAGVLTIVGVAAATLGPKFKELADAWGSGIPRPVLDSAKELEDQLKRDTKEFEALGEKSSLTLKELIHYRELKEKIDRSEAEKKERKETEAIEGIRGKDAEETIAGVREAIAQAGGGEQVERQLVQALANIGDQTGQQYTPEGITRQAQEMMREAMRGNTGSLDDMRRAIRQGMPQGQQFLADALVTPDEQRRADEDDDAFQRQMDRAKDAGAKRREAAKKAKDDADKAEKARKDADKELVDALNQQGQSNEKEGQAKVEAEDKAVEAEKKKIDSTVGKTYQRQYEIATATNNAAIATGDPRAVDPARLKAQLQNEIYAELRRRGAGAESARLATRDITGKGDVDLSRRATDAAGQNLSIAQGTLAVQHQLISEFERMSTTQRELVREVRDQQRRMKSNQRTALKR